VTAQTWNPGVSNTDGDMNAFVWIEFEGGVRVNYNRYICFSGNRHRLERALGHYRVERHAGLESARRLGSDPPFPSECDLSQYQEMHFFTPLPEVWGEPITADSIGPTGHHYDLYHWRACIESQVEPETSDVTICIRWH